MTTHEYDDFAAYAADDALLDAIGAGAVDLADLYASDDDIAALLTEWQRELDTAVSARPARGTAVVVPAPVGAPGGRRSWLRKHAAGVGAAAAVVLVASTGVAAAQSGPHGPLASVHRVLFGAPVADDTALVARVTALLDGVTVELDNARAHGGATAARISDMNDRLDSAGRLLAGDPAAPDALTARLVELRVDLAALDTVPTTPPAVGADNSGRSARLPGESGSRGPGDGTVVGGDHDGDDVSGSGDGGGTGRSGDGVDGSGDSTAVGSDGDGGSATDSGDGGSGSTDATDGGSDGGTTDTGGSDGGSTDGGGSDGGISGGNSGPGGGTSSSGD